MVVAKKSSAQIVQRTCDVAGLGEKVVEFTREFQEYRRKSGVAQAGLQCETSARCSRRRLLAGLSVSVVGLSLPNRGLTDLLCFSTRAQVLEPAPELLYPPVDLSYFDTPIGYRA